MFETRTSTKTFMKDSRFSSARVTDEMIDEIIEDISKTPSAFNLQPWRVLVVKNNKKNEELLSDITYDNAESIKTASYVLIFSTATSMEDSIDKALFYDTINKKILSEDIHKKKKTQLRAFLQNNEKANSGMETRNAVMSAVYSAHMMGLGSTIIGGIKISTQKTFMISELLGEKVYPKTIVAIGHSFDFQHETSRIKKEDIIKII